MNISLHRPVAFVAFAGPLFCGLLSLGGMQQGQGGAVSAANAAGSGGDLRRRSGGRPDFPADGGALWASWRRAAAHPARRHHARRDPAGDDADADWQLGEPRQWATNLWHYAAFLDRHDEVAPLAESPKYYDAIKKNGDANE